MSIGRRLHGCLGGCFSGSRCIFEGGLIELVDNFGINCVAGLVAVDVDEKA